MWPGAGWGPSEVTSPAWALASSSATWGSESSSQAARTGSGVAAMACEDWNSSQPPVSQGHPVGAPTNTPEVAPSAWVRGGEPCF